MNKSTLTRLLPLIIFVALGGMFMSLLTDRERNPAEIKSVLIGKPLRPFTLQGLGDDTPIDHSYFAMGEVYVVNFFASWCVPCRAEHEQLIALRDAGIKVIGIAYKNKPEEALAFLQELGDPYFHRLVDLNGRVAIDWGVYGVPETFIIRGDGTVAYKHFGPLLKHNYDDFLKAYDEVSS